MKQGRLNGAVLCRAGRDAHGLSISVSACGMKSPGRCHPRAAEAAGRGQALARPYHRARRYANRDPPRYMHLGRAASIISAMVLWAGGGDGMDSIAREMAGNASVKPRSARWAPLPGSGGRRRSCAATCGWSAEDCERMLARAFARLWPVVLLRLIVADSTYSDATGAGCWGRLLVQNMGWDLSATISWYLISFARGAGL